MSLRKKTKEKLEQLSIRKDLESIKKITKGINSRTKGHSFERSLVKFFKEELGYIHARTSRNSSKVLDNCKVDIDNVPFLIQSKKGYAKIRPKADVIFKEMEILLKQNYPESHVIHTYPKLLIHEIDRKHKYHKLVTLTFDDFREILLEMKKCKENK